MSVTPPGKKRAPWAPAADTRVVLLGGFRIRTAGKDVSIPLTAQRVVAYAALQDRPVLRSHVGAALWLDAGEAHAAASLRSALWKLRREGRDLLEVTGGSLQLARGVTADVPDAVALAHLAITAPSWWAPAGRDAALLSEDLLPAWYDEWVLAEREQYRQLRLHALESLCGRLTELGRHAFAVEAGLAAVGADPLRESAQAALIRAFMAEGNASEAHRQYLGFRTILRDELGLEPSKRLRGLVDRGFEAGADAR